MKTIRNIYFVCALLLPALAFAQTNGTLTGMAATYNYSTAPWVITSGPGTFPDGGGVATFNPLTSPVPGTLLSSTTVAFDVSPTLSQIAINTPIQYIFTTAAGQSIVGASAGLTVNTISTAQNVAINGLPTSIAFGTQINGVISGGGTGGLIKTGSGNITLAGANTYTGGTHFNGGFTIINSSAAVGDSVFGATGVGNGLSFNGGSVLFNTTGGLTTNRDILLEAGGGTVLGLTATTLGGVISGSGSFTQLAFGASGTLTLTGANTYTGATITRSGNNATGTTIPTVIATTLSGAGSIAASSSYDLMGTFTLSNTATNNTNRLSDTAGMTVRGINFVSTGNATTASSETIGAVTAANGNNTFLVTPGASASNSLTMASLTRQNNSTLTFRGTNLGNAPGNGVANIYSTAPPSGLVGGGGAPGSTVISILPYAVGNSSNATAFTAAALIGSSFVTYGADGFRPLATTEYAGAFGGNALDNVRITAVTAAPAGSTVNSLLVAPAVASTAGAPVLTGGTINVTSGSVMYSPTANVTGFIGAAINFGGAEGVISNTSTLTVSGVLSGANGLTLNTVFAPTSAFTPSMSLTGANTYTGNTTINSGIIGISGTIADGTPGAFGVGGAGSAIVLNAGTNLAGISATAATTINRDIRVIGSGPNYIAGATTGASVTINGGISLEGANLNLYGFTIAAGSAFTLNGVISGTGSIRDVADTFGIFNGNNTYSGGTTLAASSYFAGSDTAFGTGTVSINGTGLISGVGTTPRTLANNFLLNSTGGFGGTAPLTLTGSVDLNGPRSLTVSNTALTTFAGVVSNGSLTKTGAGALALNNSTGNTYTGGTLVSAGILNVNNTSGSGTGAGAISVAAAGTLSGNFSISGAALINGTLSPGNSPGTANFGSSLSFGTAANTLMELASAASFDKLNVAGLLTLDGTITVNTIGGFTVQPGMSFDLVDWGTINAAGFNPATDFNFAGTMFAPGTMFDTSNFLTNGTLVAVAIPEPSTWAMFGAGAGMLVTMLRFRRRSS
jgi:autotransporter-associated beta strand protein